MKESWTFLISSILEQLNKNTPKKINLNKEEFNDFIKFLINNNKN